MNFIREESLMLEKRVFSRDEIEKRMQDGGFNSLAKFELFIWDLEMFLQIQKVLGDKIILKGGAATQFYIPVTNQRTSIDIDMICMATKEEVCSAIKQIEQSLQGEDQYCKFKLYQPKNPKLGLNALETYYETVPSICLSKELFTTKGQQQVKIEFLYSEADYSINKIRQPKLFALDTNESFNVLALDNLFADKLTTLGPYTIGIPDDRADEQFKQIYDVITLFLSNIDYIFKNRDKIRLNYEKIAEIECEIHSIEYNSLILLKDIQNFITKIQQIENNPEMLKRANDFQGLYLRNSVNRDKAQWAIVGFQLELLIEHIFNNDERILRIGEIQSLIECLQFDDIRGPEKGKLNIEMRDTLKNKFSSISGMNKDLFRKRIERIIWELVKYVSISDIENEVRSIINYEQQEYKQNQLIGESI